MMLLGAIRAKPSRNRNSAIHRNNCLLLHRDFHSAYRGRNLHAEFDAVQLQDHAPFVPQPYGTNTASNGRTDPDRVITAGNIAWRDKIDRFSDQLIVGRPHRKSHTYAGNAEGIVSAAKR